MVYPMTTLVTCQFFLPRNAMHSANYRKSVCLYISLSHDGILSKRLNIPIIKRFSPSGSHTNQFFAVQCTKRYGSIPTRTHKWSKNRDFWPISRFGNWNNWWGVDCRVFRPSSMLITRLRLYQSMVTPKRTEQNLFVCIGKSEAGVIIDKTRT